MNEALNPSQLTTLCIVFVAFHVIALPAFYWAMRHKQFSGAEQRAWSLDDTEVVFSEDRKPPNARKARATAAVLGVLSVLTLSSIVFTLAAAYHTPAHPAASSGKCPF